MVKLGQVRLTKNCSILFVCSSFLTASFDIDLHNEFIILRKFFLKLFTSNCCHLINNISLNIRIKQSNGIKSTSQANLLFHSLDLNIYIIILPFLLSMHNVKKNYHNETIHLQIYEFIFYKSNDTFLQTSKIFIFIKKCFFYYQLFQQHLKCEISFEKRSALQITSKILVNKFFYSYYTPHETIKKIVISNNSNPYIECFI